MVNCCTALATDLVANTPLLTAMYILCIMVHRQIDKQTDSRMQLVECYQTYHLAAMWSIITTVCVEIMPPIYRLGAYNVWVSR